jgi:hypothetical protein
MRARCPYFTDGHHRFSGHAIRRCPCGDEQTWAQPGLFDQPRPAIDRTTTATSSAHPETSHQAATRAQPRSGTRRAAVLTALMAAGEEGATDEELQEQTGIMLQSEIPARNSLVKDGWAEDTGRRRPTRTGSQAIVWAFKP